MKRAILLLIVVLLAVGAVVLFLPRGDVLSAANAATLAVLRGDVDAQKGAQEFQPALDGELLASGDVVRSNQQGRAVLTFFEGSTLSVEPGSQVRVTSLAHTAGDGIQVTIEQTVGRTWASVNRLKTADSRFELKTPTMTAVVRGTTFETIVEIVNGQPVTTVKTDEGEVLVQAQGGGQTSVQAGNQVQVPVNVPAPPVTTQPPTPRITFQGTTGLGFVITDPRGLKCGSAGNTTTRQIPRCDVQGTTVAIRDVVNGSYTVLLTSALNLPQASVTVQGTNAVLTRAMNVGDLVRASVPVTLGANGQVTVGAFSAAELITSVCGAEAVGRVFSSGKVEERGSALRAYGQAEKGQPAAVVITQAELTQVAGDGASQVAGSAANISNVLVAVDASGLHLSANAILGPLNVPVRGDVIAGASGGKLIMRLRGLDAGPLPGAAKDQLTQAVDKALAAFTAQFPLFVERVALRQSCLAIIGTTPR